MRGHRGDRRADGHRLLAFLGSVLVRDRVLEASLYTSTLDSADAYQRFYREMLTDARLTEATDVLLGALDVSQVDPADVRSVTAAGVRLRLPPPELLRQLTTEISESLLRYPRGEAPALHTVIDLGDVFSRATDTIFVQVAAYLANGSSRVFDDIEQFRAAVHEFADDLARGRVRLRCP
jgi:hypothetical protein